MLCFSVLEHPPLTGTSSSSSTAGEDRGGMDLNKSSGGLKMLETERSGSGVLAGSQSD